MTRTVAVTGATGFIGRALVETLVARGYSVVALTRNVDTASFPAAVSVRSFSPSEAAPDPGAFDGVDAVVHLAGEPVDGRWTSEKKSRIYDSRVAGSRMLVRSLAAASRKPEVLVCASAVGYYGSRADETLVERSAAGADFLSDVVRNWERECVAAEDLGIRTVSLRTGIVLGNGGALTKMLAPFRLGIGGPFGSGKQFVPWIHLDDIVALYIYALETQLRGPVNAVAPDYATSTRFALAVGSALRRPAYLPAPALALRAALGEFSQTILASQLVLPAVAQDAGFAWKYPRLETAMMAAIDPGSQRRTTVRRFSSRQIVPGLIDRIFPFFAEAQNLESITPDKLRFEMLASPRCMERGAQIEYRLRLRSVPMHWRTLIAQWKPPFRFVDVQMHGPYAMWRHQHDFTPVDGGVRITDTVDYVLPFAPLGDSLIGRWVQKDVADIFAFRREAIEKRFGWLDKPRVPLLAASR
ncbi:MAG: TIGR01777 family oxidoreductase [Candidatus Eremiobacteraeota bacterium]|nr:TIGR01777 family oxidoreductase [Candidatus Eremiobacteraeota bacterium]